MPRPADPPGEPRRVFAFWGPMMRYTVNHGSAKEPDFVEMVPVGPHEAVRSDMVAVLGMREWTPQVVEVLSALKPRRKAA